MLPLDCEFVFLLNLPVLAQRVFKHLSRTRFAQQKTRSPEIDSEVTYLYDTNNYLECH